MRIAFNPSTVAALTTAPNNKDITFDLRGQNIFARGVKFYGTDTNTWRDIKINNVSIGSNILDLRNGSNTTLTNINGVVTINSTWRPVVDNLTSDSATSSLSANQGRVLAGLINGKSDSDHNHDGRYLKLTGGVMTGTINLVNAGKIPLILNNSGSGENAICVTSNGLNIKNIDRDHNDTDLKIDLYVNGYKVYNTSNLPPYPTTLPANGGNADTVDGVHMDWSTNYTAGNYLAIWDNAGNCIRPIPKGSVSVGYATSAGNADTVDGKHASDFASAEHNHDGRYVRYYAVTTLDCNNLAVGLTAARVTATNAAHTNHSAYLYISDVGTPFQIQIPDSSVPYIYKRYYGSGGWSGWFKLNAGYADSAGNADTVDGEHASNFSYTHQSSFNFNTIKNGRIVTFDQSNTDYGWINGFASTHNNYLTSVIFNSHRTSYWYVGYMEGDYSTGKTKGLQEVHRLAFVDQIPTKLSQLTNDSGFITSSASISGNAGSATKLQTARRIWGQSFNGTADVDNTLRIRHTTSNYCEGIRIQTGDGAWSTIILGATGDSGTNANAWSIHRKGDNNFAISRNSSDGVNGLVMTSVGMGLGTTAPTQRLDVAGNIRTTGNLYISHATNNNMNHDTSNPRIVFSENGSQAVGLVYTDYNSYRASKGLKVMDTDNVDTSNVWFEVQGYNYSSGYVKNGSNDNYVLLGGGGHKAESSLRVAYASNADMVDGAHLIKNGSGTGIKQVYHFNVQGSNASYIKLGTLNTVSVTGPGTSKVMFTVKGGINFGGTNESVYEVAASTRGSIQVTSTLVRGNRELKFGYVSTSSNVEIWMAYDGTYRGVTEVEVSSSVSFTLAMTETTTKPSGFVEGSYRILASTADNVASATNAYHLRINSANTWSTWYWAGQSGQPSWLWGSNDGTNMYVWNPSNFNVNTAQYLRSLGNQNCQTGRTQAYGDVYTYNTYNNTGSPTAYTSVIGFGRGIGGTVEIAGGWRDTNLYWRSLRDCCEDWYSWRTVLDSDNYTDFINNYYWANVKISTSANTQTQPSVNTIYASNWFRSQGTSGWYSESYGGGIWMNDSSWIRTYGGKSFYCDNQIYSSNSIRMSNILLEHTNEINNNANGGINLNYRNSGNVSLCQGGGKVGIGTTTPAYKLDVKGQVKASGFIHSDHSINDAVLLAGGGYERIFMLGTTRYYNNTSYELSFHKLSGLCNNLVWVDGCIWNSTSIIFQLSSDFYPYLYANSPSMRTIYRMDGNNMITVDGNGIVIISCSSYPRRVGFFYTGRA